MDCVRHFVRVSALASTLTLGVSAQADVIISGDLGADQVANGWKALNNEADAGIGNGFYVGGSYQYPQGDGDGGTGEDPVALIREFSAVDEFELEGYEDITLDWGDFGGAGGTRFALKVEDVWYFSNTNFIGNTDGTRDSIAFSASAADWTAFAVGAVDSPTEIVVGSVAGADLTGTVQGFGLFDQSIDGDGGHDYDYIAISGTPVPEPASLVLVGLGVLAMAVRSRGHI